MTYKWNSAEAQQYAEQFSTLICGEYFKDSNRIGGADILQITEVKQINLMVIKNLYEKWQEENSRLKSPFFDYDNEEVKEALTSFMNTLSRHISVGQKAFQSLLTKATYDTLQLSLEPEKFFEGLLRNLPEFKLTKEWIESNSKYLTVNKHIMEGLSSKMTTEEVLANKAIDYLKEVIATDGTEDCSDLLDDINNILPITIGRKTNGGSFFDEALNGSSETPKPVRLKPTPEPVMEMSVKTVTPEVKPKSETFTEEVANLTARLNEKLNNGTVTLNERIISDSGKSLLDVHQKRKINSLREGISFNQRHLFVRNLFGGDIDAFNQTLEALETYSSYDQAVNHIKEHTAQQFKWNQGSEEAGEFYAHLERKFA